LQVDESDFIDHNVNYARLTKPYTLNPQGDDQEVEGYNQYDQAYKAIIIAH
jgi:hypothetical protein